MAHAYLSIIIGTMLYENYKHKTHRNTGIGVESQVNRVVCNWIFYKWNFSLARARVRVESFFSESELRRVENCKLLNTVPWSRASSHAKISFSEINFHIYWFSTAFAYHSFTYILGSGLFSLFALCF